MRNSNSKKMLFVLALVGLASTGCSVDASLTNTLPSDLPAVVIQEKPGGAEFVSGATGSYKTTVVRGYKVQAAVGHYLGEPVQETPVRGYKVYSSVQGSMLSE